MICIVAFRHRNAPSIAWMNLLEKSPFVNCKYPWVSQHFFFAMYVNFIVCIVLNGNFSLCFCGDRLLFRGQCQFHYFLHIIMIGLYLLDYLHEILNAVQTTKYFHDLWKQQKHVSCFSVMAGVRARFKMFRKHFQCNIKLSWVGQLLIYEWIKVQSKFRKKRTFNWILIFIFRV